MSHKLPGFIVSCPLKPSMSSFKRFASLYPLIADSDISVHARSELWLVPCPNAQHSASINMAISSPHLTHLSRIGTASFHCPFSISRLACARVTSIFARVPVTSICSIFRWFLQFHNAHDLLLFQKMIQSDRGLFLQSCEKRA